MESCQSHPHKIPTSPTKDRLRCSWREYEDAMTKNLAEHPTLARNPAMLYRMSVPQEILESRATQRALKKMEAKGQSSKVAASSTVKQKESDISNKKMSFTEAVEAAKRQIASGGV